MKKSLFFLFLFTMIINLSFAQTHNVNLKISGTTNGNDRNISLTANTLNTLNSMKGQGEKLDSKLQTKMETAFNADFSGVRIHTDQKSEEMCDDFSVDAFTHGQDIYFGEGKYSPSTSEGQKLIGHELTHVVQQSRSVSKPKE